MNKVVFWSCRIYVGLVAAILLVNGFLWGFFPSSNLDLNGIVVNSVLGINMIKSDIGGSLIAISIVAMLFLVKGKQWFYPLVIFTSSLLIIRITSLITDGFHQTAVVGVVMEALFLLAAFSINRIQHKNT